METVTIDKNKLNAFIEEMEEKRDEHNRSSAEYIEIDEIINSILRMIAECKVH